MAWVVRDRPFLQTLRDATRRREDVHRSLERITTRLAEERIGYAVIGGMALVAHGFVRFTNDVDLLITPAGLETLHNGLDAEYVANSPTRLLDTQTDVHVEFVTTGEEAGSLAFPDPTEASVEIDGRSVITLPKLIELKLASGMTASHRNFRDLGDVQALIEALALPRELADELDPSVRDEYLRLWSAYEASKSSK